VSVDLHESRALADHLLQTREPVLDRDLGAATLAGLSEELLPDWYEEWVTVEAEDWRQLRLHALEALAGSLTRAARYGEAVAAARAAVRADPLRESSQAALIRVYLAERNRSEVIREFKRYRALLRAELGLEPTGHLRELVKEARGTVTSR
jgi:DNA-binding SARP family transcriptional activator